jgi:flagellar hook-length control protein FliK
MSATAPQPILTAPGGREPVPGGREPIPSGAPPGAPPEGPPFQSALETEWARTAIAEGQQQSRSRNPAPTDGEEASTADTSDRVPHGSGQPARHHSEHHAAPMPSGTRASASFASSTSTPAGATLTLAAALPGRTPSDAPAPDATAGGDVNQGSATHLNTQRGPATAREGSLSSGEEGIPNSDTTTVRGDSSSASAEGALTTATTATHDDAPSSFPTSPADGALVLPRDGAPVVGTLATPQDGAPTAGGSASALTAGSSASALAAGSSASALAAAPQNASIAGGAQAHSTPAAALTGDLATSLGSSAPSAGTNVGAGSSNAGGDGSPTHAGADRTVGQARLRSANDAGAHDKLWVPDPAQTATDGAAADVVGELETTTASPLLSTTLDGNPQAPLAELGSAGYGVGLQEAIESLHGTIQLAARQGLSQARISLQPEELGAIRINLTQTAQGLLARVTAESPAAAQALAAAHAQLRQSLSSLGINLTRLDIGHHDSSAQSESTEPKGNGQGGAARGEGSSRSRPGRSTAIAAPIDPATDPPAEETAPSTSVPSRGTLIDVLA